jgi:hypothetical protein
MATAPSLFGASPELIRQQREADIQAQAEAASGRDINQQVRYSDSINFNRLGDRLGGLLGGQDPAMKEASLLKSLAQGLDFNKPEDMSTYSQRLNTQGLSEKSLQASQQAQAMRLQGAQVGKAQIDLESKTDEFNKDKAFTTEIQKLGPDATDEQIVRVAVMHGTQETVMKVISASANKKATAAAAVEAAKEKAQAKVDAAALAETGKNDRAADQIASRRDLMGFAAALKQGSGEKPMTELQRAKQTKESAKSAFGLRAQDDDFNSLVAEAEAITNSKGFKGAQGTSSVFPTFPGGDVAKTEALIEGFKSRVKKIGLDQVRVGGSIGAMTEREWPIVEQMIANINPRAGNVQEQMNAVIAKLTQMRTNSRQLHAETYGEDSLPKMKAPPAVKPGSRAASGSVSTSTGALGTAGNPIRLD